MAYVRRLIWDDGNVAHIARHEVTLEEVQQVCHGRHIEREAYGGRIMLIGLTESERMISIVLDPEGSSVYYVVTARPSSAKERRLYATEQGGENK